VLEGVRASVVRIETEQDATGSGFVFQMGYPTPGEGEIGLVLTNYHVIEGAEEIDVMVNDAISYPGILLGADVVHDIAVLKICCGTFQALEIKEGIEISEGDKAVAMGYPLGIAGRASVTEGIVSALRYEGGNWVIQTDAPINPGSSGGPLLSKSGDVLGINTYKIDSTASGRPVEGMGFAVSEKTFNQRLMDLKTGYFIPPTPTAIPTPTPTRRPTARPTRTPRPTATPIPRPSYPSKSIDRLDATVETVLFYEKGWSENTPLDDREYNAFFESDTARVISWEMSLTHPKPYSKTNFVIHWQLFEGGERLVRSDYETYIESSWWSSYHGSGYGSETPGGYWDAGVYEIDFYVDGEFIARGSFEVYD
jgi:hypothetical protein